MPKEYTSCVDSEIKSGKTRKAAQRICAIAYWKRHGKSIKEAHRESQNQQHPDFWFVPTRKGFDEKKVFIARLINANKNIWIMLDTDLDITCYMISKGKFADYEVAFKYVQNRRGLRDDQFESSIAMSFQPQIVTGESELRNVFGPRYERVLQYDPEPLVVRSLIFKIGKAEHVKQIWDKTLAEKSCKEFVGVPSHLGHTGYPEDSRDFKIPVGTILRTFLTDEGPMGDIYIHLATSDEGKKFRDAIKAGEAVGFDKGPIKDMSTQALITDWVEEADGWKRPKKIIPLSVDFVYKNMAGLSGSGIREVVHQRKIGDKMDKDKLLELFKENKEELLAVLTEEEVKEHSAFKAALQKSEEKIKTDLEAKYGKKPDDKKPDDKKDDAEKIAEGVVTSLQKDEKFISAIASKVTGAINTFKTNKESIVARFQKVAEEKKVNIKDSAEEIVSQFVPADMSIDSVTEEFIVAKLQFVERLQGIAGKAKGNVTIEDPQGSQDKKDDKKPSMGIEGSPLRE